MSDARLAEPPAAVAADAPSMTSRLLSTTNLRKTYRLGRVDVPVLQGSTLHLPRGEWVAALGRSYGGPIRIGDTDRGAADDAARFAFRNRQVGFVFQFHHLLPEFTAAENVAMMRKNSDHGRVTKGLRSVVMAKARDRLSSAMLPRTTPRIIGARGKP